jgi:hypothetical protein
MSCIEATRYREFVHTKEQFSGGTVGRLDSEAGRKREQVGRYRRPDRAIREGRQFVIALTSTSDGGGLRLALGRV